MTSNRGNIQGMTQIAILEAAKSGQVRYLVPTVNGLATDSRPALSSRCYKIQPDGSVWLVPSSIDRDRDGKLEELVRSAS